MPKSRVRAKSSAVTSFRVRTPATTANLGPGFDCLGLALNWWNTIEVRRIQSGLHVECYCEDGADLPCDDRNLVVRSMRAVYDHMRRKLPPLAIKIHCDVPIGRGLGSSASAIVGGTMAANVLLGEPFNQRELLKLAAQIEGHADNVAPALLGGLVIAVQDRRELRTMRISVPRELQCILFIPDNVLSTKVSRNVLPREVPHEDAIYNVGRAALWMAALHTRQWDWLDLATHDRLHQPYRSPLIRGMQALFDAARRAGARGVALSGAGPSVIAFADSRPEHIARAMERAAAKCGVPGQAHIVRPTGRGAQVLRLS